MLSTNFKKLILMDYTVYSSIMSTEKSGPKHKLPVSAILFRKKHRDTKEIKDEG